MTAKSETDFDELYREILKLKSEKECEAFFTDLCTPGELLAMTQRVQAAKMLLEGETYAEIIEKTGISSATLSRVSRCVQYGDGYKTVLSEKETN